MPESPKRLEEIERNPVRPGIFFLRGWVSESLGRTDEAVAAYKQHLEIHAEDQAARRRYIGLLARQKRGVGAKPILELNMKHALVKAVGHAQKASNESDVSDLSSLLFEQAQILDGEVPDDPAAFAARLNRLVVRGLGAAA